MTHVFPSRTRMVQTPLVSRATLARVPGYASRSAPVGRAVPVDDIARKDRQTHSGQTHSGQAHSGQAHSGQAQSHQAQPHQAQTRTLMTRTVHIRWLASDGRPATRDVTVPATALYESAFNAFARGTLIATPAGPVAIEDLIPGEPVLTQTGEALPVQWIGGMTLIPETPVNDPDRVHLTRMLTDHFAAGKPFADLLLGPGARLVGRDGGTATLMPAMVLRDGMSMFAMRPSQPVQLYHLMLSRHAVILAGHVPVETFHPGTGLRDRIGGTPLAFLMSLFPHLTGPAGFGPLCLPRQTLDAMALLAEV